MSLHESEQVVLICVGNKLMMDDGIGPAVFDEIEASYCLPDEVELLDVGCMSMDLLPKVDAADLVISVDAVDDTGEAPGTVFSFSPEDMARRSFGAQSLHDLRLTDLFDAASLLGYEAEGMCFGMQVENRSPAEVTIGLSKPVFDALPLLVDTVLAYLTERGHRIVSKDTGETVSFGWHHRMHEVDA